jgi:hypothetical protein
MALDGDDTVSDLSQSFNIDVGAAIDLPDCRSGALPVHDEDFTGCALREEDSRERQNKSQRQEESKIVMFVHHGRSPAFPL